MMSASTSITSGLEALVTPNICILNAPIRRVSLLPQVSRLSDGVGVGDGCSVASGRKLDEVWDESTQPTDTIMRRIVNIVKTFL